LPHGSGFIFGQSAEVIAHVSGTPSLVMEYSLDSRKTNPLFWVPLRLPKGSWTSSAISLLASGEMVLDRQSEFAQMLSFSLDEVDLDSYEAVTQGLSIDRQPVFSPDGKQLMYSSNRSGNLDIWITDLESGVTSQLTDDPAGDWDPAFTPDGQSVLWSSDRSENMEIWLAAVDGSGARQISQDGKDAENPTMTRDGQWVVYASGHDDKRGIWKIRPDGTEATRLTSGSHLLPELSPDGRYVLFNVIQQLDSFVKVLDLESGAILDFELHLKVTERDENIVFGRARWEPDGKGIYYIGQDEQGTSGVYLTSFDPQGTWDGNRHKIAGFSPRFTTETLGVSPLGDRIVLGALNERRSLQLVTDLSLRFAGD
jgi:Tol biopolymer transport system component